MFFFFNGEELKLHFDRGDYVLARIKINFFGAYLSSLVQMTSSTADEKKFHHSRDYLRHLSVSATSRNRD